MNVDGHFTRIPGEECRELVRDHSVGRVAWISATGLKLFPVSYALDGELIVFRTDPDSALGELAGSTDVVFEIDDIDLTTATGWSVIVQGTAARHRGQPPNALRPWAPGSRELVVSIAPSQYSGRVVSADHKRS